MKAKIIATNRQLKEVGIHDEFGFKKGSIVELVTDYSLNNQFHIVKYRSILQTIPTEYLEPIVDYMQKFSDILK